MQCVTSMYKTSSEAPQNDHKMDSFYIKLILFMIQVALLIKTKIDIYLSHNLTWTSQKYLVNYITILSLSVVNKLTTKLTRAMEHGTCVNIITFILSLYVVYLTQSLIHC